METTLQPSLSPLRSKITVIEAIELALLGFSLWSVVVVMALTTPDPNFLDLFTFLLMLEGVLLGSWAIYNIYIRLARAGGRVVDIGLWITASVLTASYTFWAWTILDINRFLMTKLFYRGEAPVEYAWSGRSKQVRKQWDQVQKGSS